MDKAKRATIEDLIAKKAKKEASANETKELYIGSMDATLLFKRPSDRDMLEALNGISDGDTEKIVEAFKVLIYKCCKLFQSTELHEELKIVDPFDVVSELLDISEILSIGEQLSEYINVEGTVELVKN